MRDRITKLASSPTCVHVSGVKVQNDIDEEDHIDDTINNEQSDVIQGFTLECRVIRNEQ